MNSTGVMFLDETQSTGVIFVFYLSANAKVLHKFTREKSVKCIFPIQMLELRRADLVVHFVCVFLCTQVQLHAFVPLHTCETPCRYICTLSQCVYMHIYKINGGKLIPFIAFTYWPESLLQGGIMADWVCTKTGEEKGRVEEGEGKKMETCLGDIRVTRWGLKKKISGRLLLYGKKREFTNEKLGKWGFTGMNTFNRIKGL